jgi:hypothetical protein
MNVCLKLMLISAALACSTTLRAADDGHAVDVAWNGSTFKVDADPEGALGKFGGNHFVVMGVVYPAGTLSTQRCRIIDDCGWVWTAAGPVPEFPDKVIGRITSTGWFLPVSYLDTMLGALGRGDAQGFVDSYLAELGKPSARSNHLLELGVKDELAEHAILADGVIGTILPGETLTIPVTGGTGTFKGIQGEVVMTMITLVNGSGAQSFRLSYDANLFRDRSAEPLKLWE